MADVDALDLHPGAQPLDELLGRRDADVGGDQGVLDLLPGVLVETSRESSASRPRPSGLCERGEPLAEPDQPARRALRALERW